MTQRPIDELRAADDFRNSLCGRSDGNRLGAPVWHGWAIFDAFLAGIDYARRVADGERVPQEGKDG